MGLPPRLILYPRNSKPCRTWTIRVFCGLMFTPSSFKTRLADPSAARASVLAVDITGLVEALTECSAKARGFLGRPAGDGADNRQRRPLRTHRGRPRRR